jgi:hypothetical protein
MYVHMKETMEMIIDETSVIGDMCRLIKEKKDPKNSIKKRTVRLDAKGLRERLAEKERGEMEIHMLACKKKEEENRMQNLVSSHKITKVEYNSWKIKREEEINFWKIGRDREISKKAEIVRMMEEEEADMDMKATKVQTHVCM